MEREELLITETYSWEVEDLSVAIDEPEEKPVAPEVKRSTMPDYGNQIAKRAEKDTVRVTEAHMDEALDSERVARNAYTWSFIPLTGFFFLFGLPLGLIVTRLLLRKLERYSYVTPTTLEYKERAKETLRRSCIIVGLYYLCILILVLFIVVLTVAL